MNFKNINRILIVFFLISCSPVEIFKKDKTELTIQNNEIIDKVNKILNNEIIKKEFIDFYTRNDNFNWKDSIDLKKLYKIKTTNLKNSSSFITNFISDNENLLFIDDKLNLNKINILDGKKITKTKLDINLESKYYLPVSIAKINEYYFAGFSNGKLISFDKDGKVLWTREFNDILKTPIKIHNQNIILIFNSNKIISLDPTLNIINWEHQYDLEKSSSSKGAIIKHNNNIIYFIMPNGRLGSIDTIVGEKLNMNAFENINQKNIFNNNYFANFNIFNNLFVFIEENRSLYSFNNKLNSYSLENKKIYNINSSFFINNSLITLNKKNILKAYNLENDKIFWKLDISDSIKKNEQIIHCFKNNEFIIIFFSNGTLLQLKSSTGEFVHKQKLRLGEISYISNFNNLISITLVNGETIFYNQ